MRYEIHVCTTALIFYKKQDILTPHRRYRISCFLLFACPGTPDMFIQFVCLLYCYCTLSRFLTAILGLNSNRYFTFFLSRYKTTCRYCSNFIV